jgi:GT2 family glycosyltransferase
MEDRTKYAPIVLFVYKRPYQTLETLEALANNTLAGESVLYIYADGPRSGADNETLNEIKKTRSILHSKQWCKEVHIIEANENKGLADSIVKGVTEIINKYGKAIILEDDIVTSPGFLSYMNKALDIYENEERIMHIGGFVPYTTGADKLPDTYFLRFMSCWGWATWKSAWDQINLDSEYLYNKIINHPDLDHFTIEGLIDPDKQLKANLEGRMKTWAAKWYTSIFLQGGLCLYPQRSVVQNIGFDGSGENCTSYDNSYCPPLINEVNVYPINIKESKVAYNYLKRFYKYGTDSSFGRRAKLSIKQTILYKLYSKIRYK